MLDQLNVLVACADRWEHLLQAYPTWLPLSKDTRIFVGTFDWDHTRPKLTLPGLTQVIIENETKFNLAIALNAAFDASLRVRPAEWTLIVDADVEILDAQLFDAGITTGADFLICHDWPASPTTPFPMEIDHLTGTHLVKSALRKKIRGADIRLKGWGGDDLDAFARYQLAGGTYATFDYKLLYHQPHADAERTKLYDEKDFGKSNFQNHALTKEHRDLYGDTWKDRMDSIRWTARISLADKEEVTLHSHVSIEAHSMEAVSPEVNNAAFTTPVTSKKGVTLSLAMIVKNEEQDLPRVLESAKSVCDEIVIIDTGSTDRTIEIAKSYGAKIGHFEWINDFAAARNESFKHCTSDWIMWLDADDVLPPESQQAIVRLKSKVLNDKLDAVLGTYNYYYDEHGRCTAAFPRERLIRRAAGLKWQFPVHECIPYAPSKSITDSTLIVEHRATQDEYPQKIARNNQILEREVSQKDADPRSFFNYALQLTYQERHAEARDYFLKFLSLAPNHQHAFDAMVRLSNCGRRLKDPALSEEFGFQALRVNSARAEAFVVAGFSFFDRKRWAEAIPYFLAATRAHRPNASFVIDSFYTWVPWDTLSVCYDRLGRYKEALEAAEQAAKYPYEQERIQKNIKYFKNKLAVQATSAEDHSRSDDTQPVIFSKSLEVPVVNGKSPTTRKKVLSFYWQSQLARTNLGDLLTIPILDYMGVELVDIQSASKEEIAEFDSFLFTIGTLLDADWNKRIIKEFSGKRVVWGTGTYERHKLDASELEKYYDFRAVRGPRTRSILNLDPSLPLGDPALLISLVHRAPSTNRSGVLSLPHIHNRERYMKHNIPSLIGATEYFDIAVKKNEWRAALDKIACSEFVLTNSLHGCILAQAYSTPWALCVAPGDHFDKPFKFLDWFEFMGLDMRVVENYQQGSAWWDKYGQYAKLPSLQPLIDAFPTFR